MFRVVALITALPVVLVVVLLLLLAGGAVVSVVGSGTAGVPAGVLVEVYATSLHDAPCHCNPEKGFRVLVALPQGTNTAKPVITEKSPEDRLLKARNKWLLAHPDSKAAAAGAYVGLTGKNLDIADII